MNGRRTSATARLGEPEARFGNQQAERHAQQEKRRPRHGSVLDRGVRSDVRIRRYPG